MSTHLPVHGYFLATTGRGRVEWLRQRPYDQQSLKYLPFVPLQKKFATLDLETINEMGMVQLQNKLKEI